MVDSMCMTSSADGGWRMSLSGRASSCATGGVIVSLHGDAVEVLLQVGDDGEVEESPSAGLVLGDKGGHQAQR